MKTIMIQDEVYKKLSKIKGKRSFSQLLDALSENSEVAKKEAFRKVFGLITAKEAKAAMKRIKENRKHAKVRVYT